MTDMVRRHAIKGCAGSETALYRLVKELRPERPRPVVRFEGLAGELSQRDVGHAEVR